MSQWFIGLSIGAGFLALLTSSCVTKSTYVADAGPDASVEDAESDAAPIGDGGDTCAPGDVKDFTPTWKPPTKLFQGKCTDRQIAELVACYFGASGKPANCTQISEDPANGECSTCLFTTSALAQAGPIIVFDKSVARLNVPGCIATFEGNTTENSCAAKYKAATECALAACLENCPGDDAQAAEARRACAAKALDTVCKPFAAAAACADTLVGAGGKAAICLAGDSFLESAAVLGKLFCGQPVGDGGTTDAG